MLRFATTLLASALAACVTNPARTATPGVADTPGAPSATSAATSAATSESGRAPRKVAEDRALESRIDDALERALHERRIVGAVVLVARDGKIVVHRAAGLRDREANLPMTEDAIFRLASVTKPIVTVAALALVDAGKLALEDPVSRFRPDLHFRTKDGTERSITVRQLLSHTSGLGYGFLEPEDGPYHRAGVSDGLDESSISLEENTRRLAAAPLLFEPGSRFGYSLSDDLLGDILERVTGEPLPRLVARLVTQPLGMKDAGFGVNAPARLAVPYADAKPAPKRMSAVELVPQGASAIRFAPGRILDPMAFPSGGAGMAATAHDVLELLEALRTNRGSPLRPETGLAMTTNQIGAVDAQMLGPGARYGFGVSVIVDPKAAKLPVGVGTFQWGGVYGHNWWVDRGAGITVVVLTNTAVEGMNGKVTEDLRNAVYDVAHR